MSTIGGPVQGTSELTVNEHPRRLGADLTSLRVEANNEVDHE